MAADPGATVHHRRGGRAGRVAVAGRHPLIPPVEGWPHVAGRRALPAGGRLVPVILVWLAPVVPAGALPGPLRRAVRLA